MSDQVVPSESPSQSELGDVVEALEREIATFRQFRDGISRPESEKSTGEVAGSTSAPV